MRLSKKEINSIVQREIDDALGNYDDVLSDVQAGALSYYQGEMASAAAGRSNVVSLDVSDTVNSLMASMGLMFKSSSVEIEPENQEDEQQANIESTFVNRELERAGAELQYKSSAFSALLIGNGWLRVDRETLKTVENEEYGTPQDIAELAIWLQPTEENQIVTYTETDDGITIQRETTRYKLNIKAIAPENMLYSTDGDSVQENRFIAERVIKTAAELRKMGYSRNKIDDIPNYTDSGIATIAREGKYYADNDGGQQDSEKEKECYHCYLMLDINNSGESELHYILKGGDVLLEVTPAEYRPYVTGSPLPMPHRITGRGMYEQMKEIQEAKTHILRNYQDNLEVMNASRLIVVDGDVNMRDLLSGRINGVVRAKRVDAVKGLPATDIGQQAIAGLNKWDDIRNGRGGASVDLTKADAQLMQSSAAAATGQMRQAEMMSGYYTKNLVSSLLKGAFMLAHRTLREKMPGKKSAKLNGKWIETNTSEWIERENMTVTVGLTSTESAAKTQGLQGILQIQQTAMQAGLDGELTTKKKIYNTVSDLVKAVDAGEVSDYFLDPETPEAQQAMQNKQQQAQQQQQQQQAAVMQQHEDLKQIEWAKIETDRAKVELDRYKSDQETEWKYYDTAADNSIKEAEITAKGMVEMEKATQPPQPSRKGGEA